MPCSKGMRSCKLSCAHRRFVLDYVRERDAQAVRAEAATGGNATELAAYFGAEGRPIEVRIDFRTWLQAHVGADYPYPRFDPRTLRPRCDLGSPADLPVHGIAA